MFGLAERNCAHYRLDGNEAAATARLAIGPNQWP
jgi:hypothetical protein